MGWKIKQTVRISDIISEGRILGGPNGFRAVMDPSRRQVDSLARGIPDGAVRYVADVDSGHLYAFDAMEWLHTDAIDMLGLEGTLICGIVFKDEGVFRKHALGYDTTPDEDTMDLLLGMTSFRKAFSDILSEIEPDTLSNI